MTPNRKPCYWEVSTSKVTAETTWAIGQWGPRMYVQGTEEDVALIARLLSEYEGRDFGHCDTCGAQCDSVGCIVDREHPIALDSEDSQPRMKGTA